MSIIYQKDKRSGITYAYESKSYWDKEKKQSRAKRTLIGRVDSETGEIIKTDGRCKSRSPYSCDELSEEEKIKQQLKGLTIAQLKQEIIRLTQENKALRDKLALS